MKIVRGVFADHCTTRRPVCTIHLWNLTTAALHFDAEATANLSTIDKLFTAFYFSPYKPTARKGLDSLQMLHAATAFEHVRTASSSPSESTLLSLQAGLRSVDVYRRRLHTRSTIHLPAHPGQRDRYVP